MTSERERFLKLHETMSLDEIAHMHGITRSEVEAVLREGDVADG